MFVDTHCHFFKEYYDDIDDIAKKIKDAKVYRIINNGCDTASNEEVLDSIEKYEFIYGALGIHPENASEYTLEDFNYVSKHIVDKKVVAVGEIGLDYHYTKENKDKQIELFEKQLRLAETVNKPVIIHSRDATLDTINILKKYHVKGVIHSFSGSYETAMEYIKMGFLLGINGVITFKNCNLRDVIKRVDIKNIVLETDSPYLTPEPFRGQKNDSSHIVDIAKYIADLKEIDIKELAELINANVAKLFDF